MSIFHTSIELWGWADRGRHWVLLSSDACMIVLYLLTWLQQAAFKSSSAEDIHHPCSFMKLSWCTRFASMDILHTVCLGRAPDNHAAPCGRLPASHCIATPSRLKSAADRSCQPRTPEPQLGVPDCSPAGRQITVAVCVEGRLVIMQRQRHTRPCRSVGSPTPAAGVLILLMDSSQEIQSLDSAIALSSCLN